jgi:hypothetical protein
MESLMTDIRDNFLDDQQREIVETSSKDDNVLPAFLYIVKVGLKI